MKQRSRSFLFLNNRDVVNEKTPLDSPKAVSTVALGALLTLVECN